MPSKIKTALAALLVFGSASAVLADTTNRTDHRVQLSDVRLSNSRSRAVDHAVKPFTAEQKGWFDRASRVF